MRAFTMYVTVLPVASSTYYCSPKFNHTTVGNVLVAALKVLSGLGLSINGEHTFCGDYIYSGHTVILVTCFLLIQECTLILELFLLSKFFKLNNLLIQFLINIFNFETDAPNRSWRWAVIHWIYWAMSLAGIVLVLLARGHYTIDILIGYYVTTRVFWIYHVVACNNNLKVSVYRLY